jgi:predicted amidohydrolase YtcJ
MPLRAAEQVDLMLYGGKVLTVDENFSVKSTLVIRGQKILAVGGPELTQRYHARRSIDLHGRTAMPGFMDTHLHIFGASHREVDLRNATSIEQIKQLIAAKAKELGPGQWVLGNFWDEGNLEEHRRPFRADLDLAAPDNPVVMIRAGGHSCVANSLGLKAAGITRDTPDSLHFVYEHDANGENNGFVRESLTLFMPLVPQDSPEQMRASYVREIRKLLSLGLTSAIIAGADLETPQHPILPLPSWPEWQSIYRELGSELPRVAVQIGYPGPKALERYPHKTGFGDDRIKLGAIGEVPGVDGGFSGPTVCTSQDYKGQPGFRGRCLLSPTELQAVTDTAAQLGWQVGLHMLGDQAINEAIAAYHASLTRFPQPDPRWFTSHFGMLPSQQTLQLMITDGIQVSAQPNFLYTFEQRYLDNVEGEALEHINPVATPARLGIRVSFGGDDLPTDPRVGLYAAVARKGKTGHSIAPAEAVSIQDAIRMYTANPPYLTWDEKKKGTLEAGKLADVIVLDRNPLTISTQELLKMQVDATIVDGRVLYERPGAGN